MEWDPAASVVVHRPGVNAQVSVCGTRPDRRSEPGTPLVRKSSTSPCTLSRADRGAHFFAEPSDDEIGRIVHEGLVTLS